MTQDDTAFWAEQFAAVMGLAVELAEAADGVMDALRGDIGIPKFAEGHVTPEARAEVERRTRRYVEARRALKAEARKYQKAMAGPA